MRKRNKSKEDKVIQVPTLINIVMDELEKLIERNVIPSYHKTRFELTNEMIANVKVGLPIVFGIDHDLYKTEIIVPSKIQKSLILDLN